MSILIAESGSTKTDWMLIHSAKKQQHFATTGMNPFFCSSTDYKRILEEELSIGSNEKIEAIYFYGAGIKDAEKANVVKKALKKRFNIAQISAYSDMLAAARATCGDNKGITCILGTGSNSAYFNGQKIVKQNPSLGYIVGDEGSGTYLGKKVLQYFFYNTFDDELKEAFLNTYGDNLVKILDKIYKEPFPNAYLASFTEFLVHYRGHYMIENIIEDALTEFHQKHVLKYRESWKHPVHFVGSVAFEFKDILKELHNHYGIETGQIIKKPIEGLIHYHLKYG